MNLAVVFCWWAERPDWLHDAVASTRLIGASHVICCDGAYQLVRGGTPASSEPEYAAIHTGAKAAGVTYTIYTPPTVWQDNEREKRTWSFRLLDGYAAQHGCDWFCVQDADEVFIRAPKVPALHDRLAATDKHVADVVSLELPAPVLASGMEDTDEFPQIAMSHHVKPRRCLFRYQPGITVGPSHHNYRVGGDPNRDLWGDATGDPLKISDVMMQHRNYLRDPRRRSVALGYYADRTTTGAEAAIERVRPASSERLAHTNRLLRRAIRGYAGD